MSESPQAKTIASGRFLDLVTTGKWEFVKRRNVSGCVGIVAVTDDHHVLLVEQHRPPVGGHVIELPAGLAGDVAGQEQESMQAAAERELEEETGYRASAWHFAGDAVLSPGLCDETMSLFVATGLTRVGDGGGDATEAITVHHAPINGLLKWLDGQRESGKIVDVKVMIAPLLVAAYLL